MRLQQVEEWIRIFNQAAGGRDNPMLHFLTIEQLVVGTDGLWQTQNMMGEMFGKERLKTIIRREANTSSAKILQSINDALKKFRGERKQEDGIIFLRLYLG